MSQLTMTFLTFLFAPMAVALVIVTGVVLLEKREARYDRIYRQLTQTPPAPRRAKLQLVRNP